MHKENAKQPDYDNSVTIDNLLTDVEYQFQVVAVAELDTDMIMGERSNVSVSPASTDSETQCE